MKLKNSISHNTICRLPRYLQVLEELDRNGVDRTSSAAIAETLGMTPSQVRQDLSAFGTFGSQGYGYPVQTMLSEMKKILGLDVSHAIAVVGAGCIGRALIEHLDYGSYNYNITAAFDVREELIGTEINHVPIMSAENMGAWFAEHPVDICILAVPAEKARTVAKQLDKYGVPSLWNFTNVDLTQENLGCVVQNINFRDSLFVLTYYLEQNNKTK